MTTFSLSRGLLLLALFAGYIVPACGQPSEHDYLYLLNCSAHLQKFDRTTGRRLAQLDLATRSSQVPVHGDAANSVPDGCATYGVAYEKVTQTLYTLSPVMGSQAAAPRRFRILSFHIPDLRAGMSLDLPGGYEEGNEPLLIVDRAGHPAIDVNGHLRRIEGNALHLDADPPGDLPGSHEPTEQDPFYELDLSGYRAEGQGAPSPETKLAYNPLERSGEAVLIASPSSESGLAFYVADASTRHIVRLNLPFRSTKGCVHLAPGGRTVVAQESSSGPVPGSANPTGKFALLSGATGAVTRSWTDPALAGTFSLTVTPDGKLITIHGQRTTFTSLKLPYSSNPVFSMGSSFGPWFFYASQ